MNAQLPRVAPAIGSTSTGLSPYFKGGAGTRVMVANEQRQILDAMYAMAAKPSSEGYHALSMTKAVDRLRAGGDLPNAQFQHHRPNRRCLVHSGFEIEYEVSPGFGGQGTVEILAIRLTADKAKGRERSGLWDVRHSNASLSGGWLAEEWEPDFSKVPDNSSVKVGINGYSGDLLSTAGAIATHITRGSAAKEAELKKTGYKLFFTPTPSVAKSGWNFLVNIGRVFRDDNQIKSAQILASYMHEAHTKSLKVEWTSHRGGAFLLTEAMKILAQKNVDLQKKQSIFISDNTTSHAVADKYRRQLNMDISETTWRKEGYGLGYVFGGSMFGVADAQSKLNVITKDSTSDTRAGKAAGATLDAWSGGQKLLGQGAAAAALVSQFGINGALAAAVLKLLPVVTNSIPSLTNEYASSSTKAIENALTKGTNKISGMRG